MPLVQPLPVPCPAHLIPDATGTDAFDAAYRQAMAQHAVFVAIEFEKRQRWTVKADTLTAGSGHTVDEAVNDAVRVAITHLIPKPRGRPGRLRGTGLLHNARRAE